MAADDDLCWFNGVDGTTGAYVSTPVPPVELARLAFGDRLEVRPVEHTEATLRNKLLYFSNRNSEDHFGPKEGVDPADLAQTGWGVVFASAYRDTNEATRDALGELLALRREQCGPRYREYLGVDAYRAEERADQFLSRLGVGPGPAEPDRVPYYLLLVGDPAAIPYRFQYELDVQYAVGRIHFDTADEYASYAHSVVEAERGKIKVARRAAFFGTQNPDDRATRMGTTLLAAPLADWMGRWSEKGLSQPTWEILRIFGDLATKKRLRSLLGGDESPALLFTATHGMGFPDGDQRQLPHQGALLCQDWPGPRTWNKSISESFYLAADDIEDGAKLHALIAFHFACYSAGTPLWDPFARKAGGTPRKVAPAPFIARLPRRLLGHAKGGALAVIGNIDRTWNWSFAWPGAGPQRAAFESVLERVLEGHRIGFAMEYLNTRYAELSTKLSNELDDIDNGAVPDPFRLAHLWSVTNDARGYAVLGDPAVRLPLAEGSTVSVSTCSVGRIVPSVAEDRVVNASAIPHPATSAPADAPPPSDAGPTITPTLPPPPIEEGPRRDLEVVRDALIRELLALLEDKCGIEVVTYEREHLDDLAFNETARRFSEDAQRHFVTRILPGGDLHTCVSTRKTSDEEGFARHVRMVHEAAAQRRLRIEALTTALIGLTGRPCR